MNASATNYANRYLHSDVYPFEIINRITDKTIDIRAMDAKLGDWTPDCDVGGFCAHVRNNRSQTWVVTSNPSNWIVRIRKHKDGQWRDRDGNRYKLSDHPVRFHDYNF